MEKSRSDLIVESNSDVSGHVCISFSRIVHNGFGAQSLCYYFDIQFSYKRFIVFPHPVEMTGHNVLCIFFRQKSVCFVPQTASLIFFFQMNKRGIAIVVADAEFFADTDTVQFFPQGFVRQVVKVETSDFIFSVGGMFVRLHDSTKRWF